MRCELFDYELPPELIASRPPATRDGARLLVLGGGELRDSEIRRLADELGPGSLLVVNDTRVLRARLFGTKRDSGGAVELLLLRKLEPGDESIEGTPAERWEALGRASKPFRPGMRIALEGELEARIDERSDGGLVAIALWSRTGRPLAEAIERAGHVPLPPYLRRADEEADRERYQTVYARVPGAVAAPTAGLHLSEPLLDRIAARGIERAGVTLHVGLGTFQPVTVDDLDEHPMHAEWFDVPATTAAAIARTRARGGRVVAVGTTVVRALESAADPERPGLVRAARGETRLLIQPGYRFRVVDELLTNFHLPRSTLLALVCAFAGRDRVLAAYRHAIEGAYRFYSYGDAMLLRARADGAS